MMIFVSLTQDLNYYCKQVATVINKVLLRTVSISASSKNILYKVSECLLHNLSKYSKCGHDQKSTAIPAVLLLRKESLKQRNNNFKWNFVYIISLDLK